MQLVQKMFLNCLWWIVSCKSRQIEQIVKTILAQLPATEVKLLSLFFSLGAKKCEITKKAKERE